MVAEPKGGGSHYRASKLGFRSYPLPLHNGMKSELSDVYLRGVCSAFEIELSELKKKL